MIEFKAASEKFKDLSKDWHEFPAFTKIEQSHFYFYCFRIDGIIYYSKTPEFDKVYEKIWAWEQLKL